MKVNCLACGHTVALDDVYDDYVGLIKCFVCGALLEIRTDQGHIKTVQFVKMVPRVPESSELLDAPDMAEASAGR
jgi:transcription elongation factor Elf1